MKEHTWSTRKGCGMGSENRRGHLTLGMGGSVCASSTERLERHLRSLGLLEGASCYGDDPPVSLPTPQARFVAGM